MPAIGDNDDEPERNDQLLNNWFGQGPARKNPLKCLNPHVCLALNVASVVGGAMSMARLQSKESIVLDPTP
ncbi:hypothetical protein QYM36_012849 [Artemia franciscana]|uniref:Uncharacterized protein n=1 Tax=Artemia franciscana TaxID=6661 RepID=A0AA88L0I1_ARTSF|nr:hypothetical protein QYM36_012849 [Artemia franciscana]